MSQHRWLVRALVVAGLMAVSRPASGQPNPRVVVYKQWLIQQINAERLTQLRLEAHLRQLAPQVQQFRRRRTEIQQDLIRQNAQLAGLNQQLAVNIRQSQATPPPDFLTLLVLNQNRIQLGTQVTATTNRIGQLRGQLQSMNRHLQQFDVTVSQLAAVRGRIQQLQAQLFQLQ
jgi:hypothetical protein